MPLENVAPDTTLLQFLDLTGPRRRVASVPRSLREWLFRRGVPGLGWTTAAGLLAVASVVAVAGTALVSLPRDHSLRVVLTGKCVDSSGIPNRPTDVHIAAKLAETPSFTWRPETGQFSLSVHPIRRGPLKVSFRGPDASIVTVDYPGLQPKPWTITFSGSVKPPDRQPAESASLLAQQGIAAYNQGDYASATKLYVKALALDPKDGRTLDLMAYSHFKMGQYGLATSELQQALALGFPYAQLDLARVECATRNFTAAQLDLQAIMKTSLAATALKDGELVRLCLPVVKIARPGTSSQSLDSGSQAAVNQAPPRPGEQSAGKPSSNDSSLPVPTAPEPSGLTNDPFSQLQDVYFDFDKSSIRQDAQAALTKNAAILKQYCAQDPSATVIIEGHTDERGTAEYNLGLGDRRAEAVKVFLVQLGAVPADCLRTISYGKERPICTDVTEACFQRTHMYTSAWPVKGR